MSDETLTDDERGALDWFGKQANQTGRKALRIIDALTAENERLRAEVDHWAAEASACDGQRMATKTRLATAEGLLRDTYPDSPVTATQWCARRDEFLASTQPTAPTRTEAYQALLKTDPVRAMCAPDPTRTEAEQAVLDAMAALDLGEGKLDEDGLTANEVESIVDAEIALRRLKP